MDFTICYLICNLNVSLYWSTKPAVAYDVQHSDEQVHDLNLTEPHGDQASNTKYTYNKISTDSKHDNDLSKTVLRCWKERLH